MRKATIVLALMAMISWTSFAQTFTLKSNDLGGFYLFQNTISKASILIYYKH
jgi:hypothetical protein